MTKSGVKAPGSTGRGRWKLVILNHTEVGGIPGVVVECVEIGRNLESEGNRLGED
jgi:hypothetical protein